jgi:dienelactone hydrolase
MGTPRIRLGCFMLAIVYGVSLCGAEPEPMRLVADWLEAPHSSPAPGFTEDGVKAVFYDGPAWKGKPKRVFAWVGLPNLEPGAKAPGIVLIHGGGGTAFARWVKLWVGRGYAAIAMDTCGCVPKGTYGHWERDSAGGPGGWGGFGQVDEPVVDQWTYHAVADAILGHSLLRSLPEVDPDRIGVTGISWGGYLTCIVSGLDSRLKFAAPVYGCGFLGDNSSWAPQLAASGIKGQRWLSLWDPSVYLAGGTMPKLWVTGTNDGHYPLDSLQKSYLRAGGTSTLCIRLRMPHGHGPAGENPEEIRAFADSMLKGGKPLATITRSGIDGNQAWAEYRADVPIVKAELLFTRDTGTWKERKWEAAPAEVDPKNLKVTAPVPSTTTVYFLNLIDERKLVVSTPHRLVAQAR